ncbi:hypothetical protein Agub_g15665, partial [Astrephomene gubernaculifera]
MTYYRWLLRYPSVLLALLGWSLCHSYASICNIQLSGISGTGTLQEIRTVANCSCWEESTFYRGNSLEYPYENRALSDLCGASRFAGGLLASEDNGGRPISVGPWKGAIVANATSLKLTGSDLILDGSLGTGATAANLDLTANGPFMPLLYLSRVTKLTLRNLVFRNLTASGPLILLEGCSSVTLQNVTFEDVRFLSLAAAGGLIQAVRLLNSSLDSVASGVADGNDTAVLSDLILRDVIVRRVSIASTNTAAGELTNNSSSTTTTPQLVAKGAMSSITNASTSATTAASTNSLVSLMQCSSRCTVQNVAFMDLDLGASGTALSIQASPGLTLERVTVTGATCGDDSGSSIGAYGAVVHVTDGENMTAATVTLRELELHDGCRAFMLSGLSGGLSLRNLTMQDSVLSSGTQAAVLLSQVTASAGYRALLQGLRFSNLTLTGGAGGALLLAGSTAVDVQDVVAWGVGSPASASGDAYLLRVSGNSQLITINGVEVWPIEEPMGPCTWVSVRDSSQVSINSVHNAVVYNFTSDRAAIDISRCMPGCSIRDVDLKNLTLEGADARAISVVHSTGMQVSDVSLRFLQSTRLDSLPASGAVRFLNLTSTLLRNISLYHFTVNGPLYGVSLTNCSTVTAIAMSSFLFNAVDYPDASSLYIKGSKAVNVVSYLCRYSTSANGPCLTAAASAVTVNNGRFLGNGATLGGAVYLVEGEGSVTRMDILGSAFLANKATRGGAIGMMPAKSSVAVSLTISSSTFASNLAIPQGTQTALGGDIYMANGGSLAITSSTFSGASAAGGGANGGSIYARKARVVITGSTFTRNVASNRGGALYHEPAKDCIPTDSCSLILNACQFNYNSANEGGAILLLLTDNAITGFNITGTNFTANSAANMGGAISMPGNCEPYLVPACKAPADPASQALSRFYGCRFEGNLGLTGGAVYYAYNNAQGLSITSTEFVGNNATESGGLYLRAVPAVEIVDSLFSNNTASVVSAATLYSLHSRALIRNSTFQNNTCNLGNKNTGSALYIAEYDGVTANGTTGGDLFNLTLVNSTFTDNYSSNEGGAATIARCNALLEGLVFRNNSAAGKGGALYLEPDTSGMLVATMSGILRRVTDATLRRVRFNDNRATTNAGALLVSGWRLQMEDVSFVNNSANTFAAGGSGNSGGAMMTTNCLATLGLRNVSFSFNSAYQGGALSAEMCNMTLCNATFTNNTAKGDAGAALVSGFTRSGSPYSFEVLNTTFEGNTADGLGGAIKAYWAIVSAADTVFRNNSASVQGGAVYLQMVPPMPHRDNGVSIDTGVRAVFNRCGFLSNAVNNSGGALFHSGSAVHLRDCKLYNNTASSDGFISDSWSNA